MGGSRKARIEQAVTIEKYRKMENKKREQLRNGWLYTGDGFRLNTGEEYYSVYKKDSLFIYKLKEYE